MSYISDKNYFALFGLETSYKQNIAEIKAHYHQLQQKMHPDNFTNATDQEKRLAVGYAATINEAYQILLDPLKRALYLLKLQGIDTQSETDTAMPVDFLGEQMGLREELAALSQDNPQAELLRIKEVVNDKITECTDRLAILFDQMPTKLLEARLWVRKLQFYVKVQQEIAHLEASASDLQFSHS